MRKSLSCFSLLLITLVAGCVTVNVYFPEAATEQAADQFIGSIVGPGQQPARGSSTPAPAASVDSRGGPAPVEHEPLSLRALDWLIPAAHAATPNLRIHTPQINAIHSHMRKRYQQQLHKLLDDGLVGFTHDGLVAVRDPSKIPLAQRATINSAVASENKDRKALYQAIAKANGHSDWSAKIRRIFAKWWIKKAHDGWYYQDSNGHWKQK